MESIGIPISHIQELLGHENRKTTEGYIHTLGSNKVEAIEKFENARINRKELLLEEIERRSQLNAQR